MGSIQIPKIAGYSPLLESSCGYLLEELKLIWDEVGDDRIEREKVLLELEQECLEVYRKKVDMANIYRAQLHQKLADSEAEFTRLLLSLGERSFPGRPEKMAGTLKEQLDLINPVLQEMKQKKEERLKKFQEVLSRIQKISSEISGKTQQVHLDENDLSLKKLEEYQSEHQRLRKEKKERVMRMEEYKGIVLRLAATMGMDPYEILSQIHASLSGSDKGKKKNISDLILNGLRDKIRSLEKAKEQRLEKLQVLGKALLDLWELLDTPYEERRPFSYVTGFASATTASITVPGSLALDIIQQAELEVKRLNLLKETKMNELFHKKYMELEAICRASHMKTPSHLQIDNIASLINSDTDYADLLKSIDEKIAKSKEEASSRKNIMEKVEKWMAACTEENWLEEYNMDPNRYSVSRGAHKNLKRAERARIIVNRIPALVDQLMAMVLTWEEERKKVFSYDETTVLAMLEAYNLLSQGKEEEKQQRKEKKRVQGQPARKKETSNGSKRNTTNLRQRSSHGNNSNALTSKRVSFATTTSK